MVSLRCKSMWNFACRDPVSQTNIPNNLRYQTHHLRYFRIPVIKHLSLLLSAFSLFVQIHALEQRDLNESSVISGVFVVW